MVYVGNNWFRWRPLRAGAAGGRADPRPGRPHRPRRPGLGRRTRLGRPGARARMPTTRTRTTCAELGVEVLPPVRFDQVVSWMGKGVFSP